MANWQEIDKELSTATEGGKVAPGAALVVGQGGQILYQKVFGSTSLEPGATRVSNTTVFDIASLTKSLVISTLCMKLHEKGKVDLDRYPFEKFKDVPEPFEKITPRLLLSNWGGLPAWKAFYEDFDLHTEATPPAEGKAHIITKIFEDGLEADAGTKCVYSDLGYILLGEYLERLTKTTLRNLCKEYIWEPLGLVSTGYVDLFNKDRSLIAAKEIAATENCPHRKRMISGEVHDQNCWLMGGVSGHAGVFSTAEDLHRFTSEMISCYHGRGTYLDQETVQEFWKKHSGPEDSDWALGWMVPTEGKSSSGKYFSSSSVGMLGYTGCSIWIDPASELDVILLTNRVHPTSENKEIVEFRPRIHNLVMEALGYA